MIHAPDAELLLTYLAGELPAAAAVALEGALKTEPQLAERFIALARDEAVLAEWAKLVPCATETRPAEPATMPNPSKLRHLLAASIVLALAASLLLALSVFYFARPAVPTGPIAFVEDAQGDVVLVTTNGSTPIEKGQQLFVGAELRTGGEGSYAVVRYPDAARLELSADTTARLEGGTTKAKADAGSRHVYAAAGLLTAVVTQTPMVLATPHAEVRSGVGTFVCNIVSSGTCVEPEKGRVQVTRSGQDMVEVEAGFYTLASQASISKPRLRPTPVAVPQATLMDGNAAVLCLAYTPDGRNLVSGGGDGYLRFWDPVTLLLTNTIKAHQGAVRILALSSDGQMLATGGGDRFVRIWDIRSGEEKYPLQKFRNDIESLAFSPDGSTLAVGFGSSKAGVELRLYDVTTGLECGLLRTTNLKSGVAAVAFSPDGHTLATGGKDGGVHLWEVTEKPGWSTLRGPGLERFTLRERLVLSAHSLDVRALAFSPDGRLLASAGRDGAARVWRTGDGEQLFNLTEHGRDVRSVVFSRDGTLLATTGGDGMARVWQTNDGDEYAIYRVNKNAVARVVFAPDGATVATCGMDRNIKLWKLQPPPLAPGL